MSDLRSRFEEIPEIKETLQCGIYYNADLNSYSSVTGASYISLARINGACFVFQEMQKKIDAVLQYLDSCERKIEIDKKHIQELLND